VQFTLALPMLPAHHYVPLAQVAESTGFDSLAVPDSVFYPEEVSADYPYSADGSRFWSADTPFLDPFVAIAAMSTVTEQIRFYTNVLKLSIREPLLVAKTVSSLAALSGGRIGLGVGLSWIPEEFEWLGQSMRTRGKRTDEEIEVIRGAIGGGWAEFHGRHYDHGRLMISPAAPGPVPIYVGGTSDAGLRRAARQGDGWISVVVPTDELSGIIVRLTELRLEYGRHVRHRWLPASGEVGRHRPHGVPVVLLRWRSARSRGAACRRRTFRGRRHRCLVGDPISGRGRPREPAPPRRARLPGRTMTGRCHGPQRREPRWPCP
jgi:probable F420-dependent oxidoreductase